jgi:hypothetical protein
VGTTGGSGTGAVTFAVTGVCSNAGGGPLVTMTSGTGSCSITATKAGDDNYFEAVSAAAIVTAEKAAQATLQVTGAPASADNGTSFTVGVTGGSGTGALTFAATGACSNVGALVTMTSSAGICSISASKAGDADYLQATSEAVLVAASGTAGPAFEFASTWAFLSVPPAGTVYPGLVKVRLQSDGAPVAAPAGGIAVTAVSDNTECVVASNGAIAGGESTGTIGIAYGTAALPCTATVTAATGAYGSDTVMVAVYPLAYDSDDAPVLSSTAALTYFNPAPVPNQAGTVNTKVAAISYYNPAPVPNQSGTVNSKVAAISYYNPAPIPDPTGGVTASVASLSYYNPTPVPAPNGSANSSTAAMSYYNPAPVPATGGTVWASVAAVSYQNGEAGSTTTDLPITAGTSLASTAAAIDTAGSAAAVTSVSVANGPTANAVRPLRLSRSVGGPYTLRIDGANLTSAIQVALEGLGPHVTIDPLAVSANGRRVTVVVWIAPDTPLGLTSVVVTGAGWSTPDVPGMRVEIVP